MLTDIALTLDLTWLHIAALIFINVIFSIAIYTTGHSEGYEKGKHKRWVP